MACTTCLTTCSMTWNITYPHDKTTILFWRESKRSVVRRCGTACTSTRRALNVDGKSQVQDRTQPLLASRTGGAADSRRQAQRHDLAVCRPRRRCRQGDRRCFRRCRGEEFRKFLNYRSLRHPHGPLRDPQDGSRWFAERPRWRVRRTPTWWPGRTLLRLVDGKATEANRRAPPAGSSGRKPARAGRISPTPNQLQVLDGGDNDACYDNRRHQHPGFKARDIGFRIRGEGVDLAVEAFDVGLCFRGEGIDLAVEAREFGIDVIVDTRDVAFGGGASITASRTAFASDCFESMPAASKPRIALSVSNVLTTMFPSCSGVWQGFPRSDRFVAAVRLASATPSRRKLSAVCRAGGRSVGGPSCETTASPDSLRPLGIVYGTHSRRSPTPRAAPQPRAFKCRERNRQTDRIAWRGSPKASTRTSRS